MLVSAGDFSAVRNTDLFGRSRFCIFLLMIRWVPFNVGDQERTGMLFVVILKTPVQHVTDCPSLYHDYLHMMWNY